MKICKRKEEGRGKKEEGRGKKEEGKVLPKNCGQKLTLLRG
ncbi:hypothetical protein [Okeania sp. SIO1I7]|nr:hypothetical protein [Okeania sp. SIO1I7]